MKSIQFFGASGMVTGSCSLLIGDRDDRLLVDMGMFQGREEIEKLNFEPIGFDVNKINGVVVTHGHLDHCGRLPLLTKAGYGGKIFMTEATKMIVELVLRDAAKIAEEDFMRDHPEAKENEVWENVLFTREDVELMMNSITIVEYGEKVKIEEFEVVFRDAGHILGSASIVVDSVGKKIVFSGDLGNSPEDMIRPTEQIKKADFVVTESTYGGRLHTDEDATVVLEEEIVEVERTKGVLLIPSFSIERAQEILHRINHLKNEGRIGKGTRVYLDSPMAIKMVDIFRKFPELYNSELARESKVDDPFDFPGLELCEEAKISKKILFDPPPKVIIAGSGMIHGGRILHHAKNYLSERDTRILLVGYQGAGTTGRFLEEGLTRVRIFGEEIEVKAHVRRIDSMSCHADQKKLLEWLGNIEGIKKVFLNHGDDEARVSLAGEIRRKSGIDGVILPELKEIYDL